MMLPRLINTLPSAMLLRCLSRKPVHATYEQVWIPGPSNKQIYAHLHKPVEHGDFPLVIFVPGGKSSGSDYDRKGEIQPACLASLKQHAMEMINLATGGRAKWTQLNQNKRNTKYDLPVDEKCWIGIRDNHKLQLLSSLLNITRNDYV